MASTRSLASGCSRPPQGEYGETLRIISLNGNAEIARPAFQAAVRCHPGERWLLLWGSYIVEKYEPKLDHAQK